MSTAAVGHLESAALKRKARLEELRAKKAKALQGKDQEQKQDHADAEAGALPKPIFRSYKPIDDNLKESELPDTEPGEVAHQVREELDKESEAVQIGELDFTNLAPRKPDWDLKRDIAPKLEKLERRTQRAIAELIRERLREEDLANAVNAGAQNAQRAAGVDDDDDED